MSAYRAGIFVNNFNEDRWGVELAAAREAGKLQKPTPISETYVGPLEFEPKRKHNAVDVGTIVCCSQHKERGRMEKCIKICQ